MKCKEQFEVEISNNNGGYDAKELIMEVVRQIAQQETENLGLVRIPEQIAVVGFGDDQYSAQPVPAGSVAGAGEQQHTTVTLKTSLVIRESTVGVIA